MKKIHEKLADYFVGVGGKRLAAVDTRNSSSNQHEINGSGEFLALLGSQERRARGPNSIDNRFPTKFIWLGSEDEMFAESGLVSWYDTRKQSEHRRPEWRLYYQNNAVTALMREGDALFVALRTDGSLLLIVAPEGSTAERQLLWLFGFPTALSKEFSIKNAVGGDIGFAARFILGEIGEEIETDDTDLDYWLKPFRSKFPTTSKMSEVARLSLPHVRPEDDADHALISWLEREEQLFRKLEHRLVEKRLRSGFFDGLSVDVDGFISFSMSVQNRRKARMGHSLENHLQYIFLNLGIAHDRGQKTENNYRPDFLFPGQRYYLDSDFPTDCLTMLGAKSTCKDRWRQVLSEAARIGTKHLLTLEPSISVNQTDQMRAHNLQLVVPTKIQATYTDFQRSWLMSLTEFISLVRSRVF